MRRMQKTWRNGKNGIDMELIKLENVMATLEEYANKVRNEYQDNLIRSDRIAAGGLLNDVEYLVEQNGMEYEVKLCLKEYWKYVEEGVKGDRNPTSPYKNPGWGAFPHILDWISVKPVLPKPLADGKLPNQKQLAYLITRSIVKEGTQGSKDLQNALATINAKYKDKMVYALQEDLEQIMKVMITDFQGSIQKD